MRQHGEAHSNEVHVKPYHSNRVAVWSGKSKFGITDPKFVEDETGNPVTVTSDRYVYMADEFLFPEFRLRDIDLATIWFQQDEATAHTVPTVDEHLKTCVQTPHNIPIWLHFLVSSFARPIVISFCGVEKQNVLNTSSRLI